jgi:hypothetical protein
VACEPCGHWGNECSCSPNISHSGWVVAKRKTLFDDRPVEISELTFIIKRDISELNAQILSLQNLTRNQPPAKVQGGKQVDEHNNNVVMMLQSKLANTSMGFKDVLEIRTQVSWGFVKSADYSDFLPC